MSDPNNLPVPVPETEDVGDFMLSMFRMSVISLFREVGAGKVLKTIADAAVDQGQHFKSCPDCNEFYEGDKTGPMYEEIGKLVQQAAELGDKLEEILAPKREQLRKEAEAIEAAQRAAAGPVIEGEVVEDKPPTIH